MIFMMISYITCSKEHNICLLNCLLFTVVVLLLLRLADLFHGLIVLEALVGLFILCTPLFFLSLKERELSYERKG